MNVSQFLIRSLVVSLFVAAQVASAGAAVLTDSQGMTAYVFDKDGPGVSNCYDACAKAWPPIVADGSVLVAPFTSIVRKDGIHQLAYNNRPIYTFVGDGAAGDTRGDGLGGIWHVINK